MEYEDCEGFEYTSDLLRTRKYLKDLEEIQEKLDGLPYFGHKTDDFYEEITSKIDKEYKRMYKLLEKKEVIKNGFR